MFILFCNMLYSGKRPLCGPSLPGSLVIAGLDFFLYFVFFLLLHNWEITTTVVPSFVDSNSTLLVRGSTYLK